MHEKFEICIQPVYRWKRLFVDLQKANEQMFPTMHWPYENLINFSCMSRIYISRLKLEFTRNLP